MEERIYGLRSIVRRPNSKLGLHLSENATIISLAHLGAWRSPASALAWGARGRRFKSSRPDREYEKPSLPGTFLFLITTDVFEYFSWSEVPHRGTGANSSRPDREYEKPSLPGTVLFLTLTCNKVVSAEGGLIFQAKQKKISKYKSKPLHF